MPVVSDFTVIQQAGLVIGDRGTRLFEKKFSAAGRSTSGHAYLQLMVKGLTGSGDLAVRVNGRTVGVIESQPGDDARHWSTQLIPFPSSVLHDGDNELEIRAKPSSIERDSFDDCKIQAVVCCFKQAV